MQKVHAGVVGAADPVCGVACGRAPPTRVSVALAPSGAQPACTATPQEQRGRWGWARGCAMASTRE